MNSEIRVLFVDAYRSFQDLTAAMLERVAPELTILTERTPTAAIERLREEPIDCVISSYELSSMNGPELCASVREDHPDLPFFLFTAYDSSEVLERALAVGVTDYVQKESGADHFKLLANRVVNGVERHRLQDRVIELESGA